MPALRPVLATAALLLACALAHASVLPGIHELEQSLRLDAPQKAQFDMAAAATQRALLSVAYGGVRVKERIAEELGKPHPDLNAIARTQAHIIDQSRPLFREARREWEKLYATLDPGQVRKVRAYVDEKLGRLERFAEAIRGLLGEGFRR